MKCSAGLRPNGAKESARAHVDAATGPLPGQIVLARDRLRCIDRLIVLWRNQLVALANLAAEPARGAQRESLAQREPHVKVRLHREHRVHRPVRILDVAVGVGPAQIPPSDNHEGSATAPCRKAPSPPNVESSSPAWSRP